MSEGVVLCHEYNANADSAAVTVFDANEISNGPFCRIMLEKPIPFGFHTAFVASTTQRISS